MAIGICGCNGAPPESDSKDVKQAEDAKEPEPQSELKAPKQSKPIVTVTLPPSSSIDFQPPDPSRPLRSFDQIVALPTREFDIAEAVLALGQEAGVSGDPQAALKQLNAIAARARADLPDNPDVLDYFDTFYEVVLDRKSAEPFRDDRAEDYDLCYTLSKHRGSCLSVGIMTLAVARRMGAPVSGAQCPAHFFLRATAPTMKGKKESEALNFDVTRLLPGKWDTLNDEFYRKWQHFDEHAEASGAYMRPLTDREVVSVFLSSRSGFYASKKMYTQSLKDAERSLELNSRNMTACINAGFAQEQLNNLKGAKHYYMLALKIDPNSVRALNNLAYTEVKDPQSSEFDQKDAEHRIESALRLDPNKAWLHATDGEVKAAKKDWRAATRALQDAVKLEPKNATYRERFMALREKLRAE